MAMGGLARKMSGALSALNAHAISYAKTRPIAMATDLLNNFSTVVLTWPLFILTSCFQPRRIFTTTPFILVKIISDGAHHLFLHLSFGLCFDPFPCTRVPIDRVCLRSSPVDSATRRLPTQNVLS